MSLIWFRNLKMPFLVHAPKNNNMRQKKNGRTIGPPVQVNEINTV